VKLISNVGDKEEPIQVLRDPLPAEARIISLVYRPELGGWRVHGIGHPVDPTDLPRSWPSGTVAMQREDRGSPHP
jgi:hypothetical protein